VYRGAVFECRHQPFVLRDTLVQALANAYAEPRRAYHTAAHIADVLGWYDRVADAVRWDGSADVYAAIVFHDAIYVPGAHDNEARSAAWARDAGYSQRTAELIELTARHGRLAPDDVDHDAALFLDCDMAILGSEPAAFAAYDAAIAFEYQHVPGEAYRAGRRRFLAGLLANPRIFLSGFMHAELDARARSNLAAALIA
jgi:predicted metal-dependent HD superfamily phosphohydrolase